MEVILLENIRNLGQLGEGVSVKDGYGRNYLIPQGKAVRATPDNIKYFQERRQELEQKAAEKMANARAKAEQLSNLSVEIKARAGDEGKLFGSIGVREVADAITSQGIEVKKSEVVLLEGAIRMIGQYVISIQLHPEVEAEVNISVVEAK